MTFTGASISAARSERERARVAARNAAPDPEPAGTLHELARDVFRARSASWSPNTVRNRDDEYRLRIAPALGTLRLEDVTRQRVEVWLADLIASGASRRALVQAVATLRVLLGAAVEWGRIPENPARRLRLPPPDPNVRPAAERVPEPAVLARIVAAGGTLRTRTLIRTVAETGIRRGEAAGLRWPDVNLAAGRIEVRRQVVQERLGTGGGHVKHVRATKGGRSRLVAITPGLAAVLGDWYAESVAEGGADAAGYVFPGKDGGPMHDRSLARAIERAVKRAGAEHVWPHLLRHAAASYALADRVPSTVVAAQLGHADPSITARIYAHLLRDSDLDQFAEVFASREAETVRETVRETDGVDGTTPEMAQ